MSRSIPSTLSTALLIRLGTDGFSFAACSAEQEGMESVKHYAIDETLSLTANLKHFIKERQWDAQSFQRVEVIIASERFTTMPLELFEDEQAEHIFNYNLFPRENEEVHYSILSVNNIVLLYGIDRSAVRWLSEQMGNVRFHAQSALLIERFATESRRCEQQSLYAHLRPNAMEVYAFHQGQLLLANSQACSSPADRLYYLLYLWKQLQFNASQDQLLLCGERKLLSPLLSQLPKYIRQITALSDGDTLDFKHLSSCE